MKSLIVTLLLLLTGCTEQQPATEVIALTASWCGPCKRNEPVIARLEKQGVKIRRVDIDENPTLAAKYHVTSVPTYLVLRNGKEVKRTQNAGILARLLGRDQ